MGENYFDILGIGQDADDEAVKQAFRELAKTYHPDRNPGDAGAEQHFKLINTAYEALKDAHRREAYIEWLHFAETRERSKAAQWGRISALLAVLIFGPVLLYLALASTDGTPPAPQPTPAAGNTAPAAPTTPSPQKPEPGPGQGMHIAPQQIPVTEASKTPPKEAPANGQADPANQAGRWEPRAESVPPATTETLPRNAPDAGAGSQRIAKAGESQSSAPLQLLPPGGGGASTDGAEADNFIDCETCPRMTTASDPRYLAFKDRSGRLISRESVAVSQAEITVAQWNACVAEGSCPRYVTASQTDPQRPVRNVSPRDASTFTDWLSRKSGRSYWVLADSRGEINPSAEADGNCSAGWEWLEDGCYRRASTYVSFRVLRDLRANTD